MPAFGERDHSEVTRRPGRAILRTEDATDDLQWLAARAVEGNAQATESLLGAVHRMVHRYCRARLSAQKVPAVVEFRDAIPRSATGKVLRGRLAEA